MTGASLGPPGPESRAASASFLRDGGTVLRTWSGYGPVISLLCETDILLDLTPLGRQDEHVELLHHDRYPEGGHDQPK